jgi:hypothetical protein
MRASIIYSSALLLLFSTLGSTLEVAPDSKCALLCIDDPAKGNVTDRVSSGTEPKDVDSCYNKNYTEDAVGKKFADCKGYILDYKLKRSANTSTL